MITYRGVFQFAASRATLWEAVSAIDAFPLWAPWLHDMDLQGPWLEHGTKLTFDVVSPLPYRLKIGVELTDVIHQELIAADVHHDLSGRGRMTARDHAGGTEVELSWEIEPRARFLQTFVRFSGPFVRWTQDWAVRAAVAGVRRKLHDPPTSMEP